MSDRIEEAARVLFEGAEGGVWDVAAYWEKAIYRGHAHDLAKAGLLATREDWGTQLTNESRSYIAAAGIPEDVARREAKHHSDATAVRRWVTEWEAME